MVAAGVPSPLKMSLRNNPSRRRVKLLHTTVRLETLQTGENYASPASSVSFFHPPLLLHKALRQIEAGWRNSGEDRRPELLTGLGADLNHLQGDEVHLKPENMKQQKEGEQANQSMDPRKGTEKDAHLEGSLQGTQLWGGKKGQKRKTHPLKLVSER